MITVTHLSKRFGDVLALDDVTFTAAPGRVVGFLGPNGAGKTTALRILTGLSHPTSGTANVLGNRYADLPNPGRHVGVLLDASAQHPGRTGREVLRLGAMTMGLPGTRVDDLLAVVGLSDAEAGKRVGTYSLGMRQRLGIAHALLGDPSVLVLDEPANGLDPQGIHWMRGLLRAFADEGGTVLLSSHLLAEIQQIADELVVIGHGRIVAAGPLTDLLGSAEQLVRSTDDARLADALARAGHRAQIQPDGGIRTDAPREEIAALALADQIPVVELTAVRVDLEDVFLSLTADSSRGTSTTKVA